jgi:hypothetical protein
MIFITSFTILVLLTGFVVKGIQSDLPEEDEIAAIVIADSLWVYDQDRDQSIEIDDLELGDDFGPVALYESREAIEILLAMNSSIYENATYHSWVNMNFIYYLKNGDIVRRYFTLEPRYEGNENEELDVYAGQLMLLEEHQLLKYPFIFDDNYAQKFEGGLLRIHNEEGTATVLLDTLTLQELTKNLRLDYESAAGNWDVSLHSIIYNNRLGLPYPIKGDVDYEYNYFNIEIVNGTNRSEYFDIPPNYIFTRDYLEQFID